MTTNSNSTSTSSNSHGNAARPAFSPLARFLFRGGKSSSPPLLLQQHESQSISQSQSQSQRTGVPPKGKATNSTTNDSAAAKSFAIVYRPPSTSTPTVTSTASIATNNSNNNKTAAISSTPTKSNAAAAAANNNSNNNNNNNNNADPHGENISDSPSTNAGLSLAARILTPRRHKYHKNPPTQEEKEEGNNSSLFSLPLSSLAQKKQSSSSSSSKNNNSSLLLRYRGFSTSISSLFLDETLVCPSAAWCGILSSSRTEYLLHVRNKKRKVVMVSTSGVQGSENGNDENYGMSGGYGGLEFRGPSRNLALGLVWTILGIVMTFVIWGFGSSSSSSSSASSSSSSLSVSYNDNDYNNYYNNYYNDYNHQDHGYNDYNYGYGNGKGNNEYENGDKEEMEDHVNENNRNRRTLIYDHHVKKNRQYYVPHVMRLKDYRDRFWIPLETMAMDVLCLKNGHAWNDGDSGGGGGVMSIGPQQEPALRYLSNGNGYGYSNSNSNSNSDNIGGGNGKGENFWSNQQVASNIRSGLWVLFFIALGTMGRRQRMKTRFAVLKARMQDDKAYYGFSSRLRWNKNHVKVTRESKYDGACSHTLCGCYPVDQMQDPSAEEQEPDCMNGGYRLLSKMCCGFCCRLWVQCFSICALAQEAREARLLLPPKDQRVDYLTHQPFEEYYRDVYFLRRRWKSSHGKSHGYGWKSHFAALSKLSRYILTTFFMVTVIIIVTEWLNPLAVFSWADACVLMMTFVQSFIVLGIFHGFFHKSDLSLDAVIKFFAAGFVIATPMAFLMEVIVVNIFMSLYYVFALVVMLIDNDGVGSWFYNHYRYLLVVGDIIQAFLVAAASEEICKYYAFRCVEHPDLIFLTGLDRSKQHIQAANKVGGGDAYPFSSNNASAMECRVGTFETSLLKTPGKGPKNHRGISPSIRRRFSFGSKKELEQDMEEEEVRTVRQRAAAVTIAMISTAVGLACAENFIYVFFLSGNNTQEEITMLLFRSIFPVHALCAGIQSIGVIRKFLEEGEEGKGVGVGKIVLPSIILHGTFDSVLMMINSYIDFVSDSDDDGFTQPDLVYLNIIAACCVTSVMLIGTIWYWRQNRQQKARLKMLEIQCYGETPNLSPLV